MEMKIIIQGKNDHPKLRNIPRPIVDLSSNEKMTVCVIEGGMGSGEPSVMIISSDDEGSVCLQTSLDKFMMAASAMASAATHHWGWVQQEGSFTLMPPDEETRKQLLESIKEELEGWGSL